jgi:hypothetical protein
MLRFVGEKTMCAHAMFMNLRGIRIDDEYVSGWGGRIALADICALFVVEEPRDFRSAVVSGTGVASAVMTLLALWAVPACSAAVAGALVAFASTTVVVCLLPHRVSLWASSAGCADVLLESSGDTFVNQVCRALFRACEWSGSRRPVIYRVAARHYRHVRLDAGARVR